MKITRFVPSVIFGEKSFNELSVFIDKCYPDKTTIFGLYH